MGVSSFSGSVLVGVGVSSFSGSVLVGVGVSPFSGSVLVGVGVSVEVLVGVLVEVEVDVEVDVDVEVEVEVGVGVSGGLFSFAKATSGWVRLIRPNNTPMSTPTPSIQKGNFLLIWSFIIILNSIGLQI